MIKKIYIILIVIVIILTAITGFFVGIKIENNRQLNIKQKKNQTTTIAIVNMDEGVILNDEHVNYANQLLCFPNENFIVTGLSDAKTGINNIYAAYIIIPATFSKSVMSIEYSPEKINLTYQYNSNLDEEVFIQVTNEVNDFINIFNSNIAYMYIDAIIGEYHRVQDDSVEIIENERAELENIMNIKAAQLIAPVELVKEEIVDQTVQPVDLNGYYYENDRILNNFYARYSEAFEVGRGDYSKIQETHIELEQAEKNFSEVSHVIIEDMSSDQQYLLEMGKRNLAEAIGSYNSSIDNKQEEVYVLVDNMMRLQLEQDQKNSEEQLENVLHNLNRNNEEDIALLQSQWLQVYSDIQESVNNQLSQSLIDERESEQDIFEQIIEEAYTQDYITAYQQGYLDALTQIVFENSEAEIDEVAIQDIVDMMDEFEIHPAAPDSDDLENAKNTILMRFNNETMNNLNNVSIDWNQLQIVMPSPSLVYIDDENTDREEVNDIEDTTDSIILNLCDEEIISQGSETITNMFRLNYESDEIDCVLQDDFVTAIYEHNQEQLHRLSEPEQLLKYNMSSYENALNQYDPMVYIEAVNADVYFENIEDNAKQMLNSVKDNNQNYQLYASDVYSACTGYTSQLRGALDDAHTLTSKNIEECIVGLQSEQEKLNSDNIKMLESFAGSLSYTRVESQGNAEIYDYIVNPITVQKYGQAIMTDIPAQQPYKNMGRIMLVTILGIIIVICIVEFIVIFKRNKEARS